MFIDWGFGAELGSLPSDSTRHLGRTWSYLEYDDEAEKAMGQNITTSAYNPDLLSLPPGSGTSLPGSRHSSRSTPQGSQTLRPIGLDDTLDNGDRIAGEDSEVGGEEGLTPSSEPPARASYGVPDDVKLKLRLERESTKIQKLKASMYRLRELNENKVAIYHGVHKATAAVLASILFIFPYLAQFSVFPAWATITAYCTATTYAGTSFKRCITEALGSAIGSFLAFGYVYLIIFTGPDCNSCAYKPYVIGISLWLTIFFLSYLAIKKPQWELSIEVGLISFLVIFATEYLNPEHEAISISYVFDRSFMIVAGVIIAFLVSFLIFPIRGSQMIKKGLKNSFATDFGAIMSGVLELYSLPSASLTREEWRDRKLRVYSGASAILTKISKMQALVDTTKGEVSSVRFQSRQHHHDHHHRDGSGRYCEGGRGWCYLCGLEVEMFPAKRYTTIMFCSNQLIYITVTLFYGLQGDGNSTAYCKLFQRQLDAIRLRFEKMFVDIATMLDKPAMFLEVAAHVQVVKTLLEQLQTQHKENLSQGVTFSYSFDDVQTFSHLWSCLKLYLKKVSHLVDAIHHSGGSEREGKGQGHRRERGFPPRPWGSSSQRNYSQVKTSHDDE